MNEEPKWRRLMKKVRGGKSHATLPLILFDLRDRETGGLGDCLRGGEQLEGLESSWGDWKAAGGVGKQLEGLESSWGDWKAAGGIGKQLEGEGHTRESSHIMDNDIC
jgi:hypothetical protein